MADRKPFLLRIDSVVLDGVQRWANDDLRSLNAQIEYLLRESLRRAGRSPRGAAADRGAERSGSSDHPLEAEPTTPDDERGPDVA